MDSFEQAFSDTERAAKSTLDSAGELIRLVKQLQEASREGNLVAMKRTQGRLNDALGTLGQTVANAVQAWPFQEGEEEQYLRDGYSSELRRIASEQGLDMHEQDDRLISHPSVVRILPGDRAVRIDKKKVSSIRPSYLAKVLLEKQKKPSRYPSGAFLESLYAVYSDIVEEEGSDRLVRTAGRVVRLERIYRLFTSLPGSNRDYDRTDFARDLYMLHTKGPERTKRGAAVSFPSSTGTRNPGGVFSFVGPDGRPVQYYGLRFTEGDR